jgi:tRNA (cytidine56-2'-O)-methyltransferase
MADVEDQAVKATVEKIVASWGGRFRFEMGKPWRQVVKEWRSRGSVVAHLTAYGENIQTSDVMERIRALGKDVLVIVGSQKVPKGFFWPDVSDFNVAVGNQPHSEVSSLAVFLDRFFGGRELAMEFKGAKLRIIPQERGKKTANS